MTFHGRNTSVAWEEWILGSLAQTLMASSTPQKPYPQPLPFCMPQAEAVWGVGGWQGWPRRGEANLCA